MSIATPLRSASRYHSHRFRAENTKNVDILPSVYFTRDRVTFQFIEKYQALRPRMFQGSYLFTRRKGGVG